MRTLLRTLLLLLPWLPSGPAAAQRGTTALLAGYGGIDHEASLGPAVHANLRHALVRWDSIPLGAAPHRAHLPRFEIQAEAFAQLGQSGTRLTGCRSPEGRLCTRTADPVYLIGAGLVTRAVATSVRRPVRLYFLPVTAAVYLRGYELHEGEIGSGERRSERAVVPAAGIGNGIGVEAELGGVRVLLDVRAILVRDLEGARGGSLPVSVGVAW